MKKQVFISSTYIDLIKHREAVWELLKSFNVKVTGMEEFGARTEKPLETCLKEVEESDIFISVIGMRYGSVEPTLNRSFSELEYEKAVELKKEIFIYLIDEGEACIVPNTIDFKNHVKLKEFKSRLKVDHTVDSFVNEQDLSKKLSTKLKKHLGPEIRNDYRPRKIDADLIRVDVNNEPWVVVFGYRFGEPFEIFAGPAEDFLFVPSWLEQAEVIMQTDDKGQRQYNLFYVDKDGYKVTIEGLSRLKADVLKLTSKLLENEIPLEIILEIVSDIELDAGNIEIAVKKALKKIIVERNKKGPP